MSWVVGVWALIFFVRWVWPVVSNMFRPGGFVVVDSRRRGKVLGHRGPAPRSFKGRIGRKEWWLSTLGNTLVMAILNSVPAVGAVLSLPWLVGTFAVNARRLHDLTRSAWLQIVPIVFGIALAAFYAALHGFASFESFTPVWNVQTLDGWLTIFAAITALAYLTFYAWIGFTPGHSGPNAYGEAD